jgi:hypothetical protein
MAAALSPLLLLPGPPAGFSLYTTAASSAKECRANRRVSAGHAIAFNIQNADAELLLNDKGASGTDRAAVLC